jgi:alpha-galactosidase
MKIRYKLTFTLSLVMQSLFSIVSAQQATLITIPYGKGNAIAYNLESGTYNVYHGKAALYTNVSATFKIKDVTVMTTGSLRRQYTSVPVSDGFGKGQKWIVTLTANHSILGEYSYCSR